MNDNCTTKDNMEDTKESLHASLTLDTSTSGPSSITFSGDNEEEYLRGTWQRLGVGHDGFLSLEELATVCHAIGMDKVASEVIEQLFSRLDVDGDGRISFEEFLQMFQSGGQAGNHTLSLDDSLQLEVATPPRLGGLSSINQGSGNNGFIAAENGIFATLDPNGSGYVSVQRVVAVLDSVNVPHGARLLQELGFSHRSADKIRLQDLALALEEECRPTPSQSPAPMSTHQASVFIMLNEAKALRLSLESARGERDKLRQDLNDAHQRLAMLAQELDEHTAHVEAAQHHQIQELERQYRDQIRELQEKVSEERETAHDVASSEARDILARNAQLINEETRLKSLVNTLQADVQRLEADNVDISRRCEAADQQVVTLEKQLSHLSTLQNKVSDFDSFSPREEEYCNLLERLQCLTDENQRLRDQNDELHTRLESLTAKNVRHDEMESLDGSCIGDYLDQPSGILVAVKRRGSVSAGSGEDSNDEDSPRESKIRRCGQSEEGLDVHYMQVGSYDDSFYESNIASLMKFRQGGESGAFSMEVSSPKNSSLERVKTKSKRCAVKSVVSVEEELRSTKVESDSEESKASSKPDQSIIKNDKENVVASNLDSMTPPHCSQPSAISTPIKTVTKEKCTHCADTEKRLAMALEELDMSLQREGQSKLYRMDVISKRKGNESTSDSYDAPDSITTAYPVSEESHAPQTKMKVLEEHCRGLEGELARVRVEVIKMVEEREALASDKQNLQDKINQLNTHKEAESSLSWDIEQQCKSIIAKLRRKRMEVASNISSHEVVQTERIIGRREDIPTIPEEEEPPEDQDDSSSQVSLHVVPRRDSVALKEHVDALDFEIYALEEDMKREKEYLEKQKANIEERCVKAEETLEVLKSDLEKSEDYWNLKLQEEREYYEEERKLYDDKFTDLVAKIREYEELDLTSGNSYGAGHGGDPHGKGYKLSTIEESVFWEKQVTELEEELSSTQKQLMKVTEEKDMMENALKTQLCETQKKSGEETSRLTAQLSNVSKQLKTSQNLNNSLKDELERVQRKLNKKIEDLSEEIATLRSQGALMMNGHMDSSVTTSLKQGYTTGEDSIVLQLQSQLTRAQSRIRTLENANKQHQKYSHNILTMIRQQHSHEVQNLETMIANSKTAFTSNVLSYKDKMTNAFRGDKVIRDLYLENTQLMKALTVTEERQKNAEEALRKLQLSSLSSPNLT